MRRVIPADPQVRTHVLCLELTPIADQSQDSRADAVHRLASREWPMHVLIYVLTNDTRRLKAKVTATPGSALG